MTVKLPGMVWEYVMLLKLPEQVAVPLAGARHSFCASAGSDMPTDKDARIQAAMIQGFR
jgi:hypothetical protein